MMENNGCVYSLIKLSPVDVMRLCRCYETEFRSLMGLGKEAPPQSLSFCHHAPEALARCSEIKKWLPG